MQDFSINPITINLGRPFEPPTYDSSASFPKRFCKWCGVEADRSHEESCEKHLTTGATNAHKN
jgi:hypothetical protein